MGSIEVAAGPEPSSASSERHADAESKPDSTDRIRAVQVTVGDPTVASPSLSEAQLLVVHGLLWRSMNEACNLLEGATEASWPTYLDIYVFRTNVAEAFARGRYEALPDEAAHDRFLERAIEAGPSCRLLVADPALAGILGVTVDVGLAADRHPLQRLVTDHPDSAMHVVRRHCIDAFNGLPIALRRQMLEADAAARRITASEHSDLDDVDPVTADLLRGSFRRSMVGWVLTEH